MAINPNKCIKVTGRFHSTQGTVGDPALTNVVSGADEVYDDNYPLLVNGYIECDTTPISDPTGNPHEQGWCEEEVVEGEGTDKYILTEDTSVELGKSYYKPIGAKQDAINNQLRTTISDINSVIINADNVQKVITPEASKIVGKEDGYVPTAGAVGRALGANFEDNLQSTSTVKGLTANMGRVLNENKADINGYYETMSVGSAKNLDGENINSEAYLIRPTGGENNEVVSGLASVVGIEGESQVWNQLAQNEDFGDGTTNWTPIGGTISAENNVLTFTAGSNITSTSRIQQSMTTVPNHVYYGRVAFKGSINGRIRFRTSNSINEKVVDYIAGNKTTISCLITESTIATTSYLYIYPNYSGTMVQDNTFEVYSVNFIDLTLLGIDNLTTVAEVEEWLAQHVGTKPYYKYNAGEILSAKTLGIKTYNRNLLNPTTKQAKLIPYTHTTNSNKYTVKGIPTGAAVTYTPDNTGVAVDVTETITDNTFDISSYGSGTLYIPNATSNTYVCMKYDGSMDDEVVPYKDNTYNFDVTKVYGKVSGAGEYVQCFPDGMKSAGSVYDTLTPNEAILRVRTENLGKLTYSYHSDYGFYVNNSPINTLCKNGTGNIIVNKKYKAVPNIDRVTLSQSNFIVAKGVSGIGTSWTNTFTIKDSDYNDPTLFKSAMNTFEINYELATPITYTNIIYRDGGVDRPLREVLVNLNVDNWSMEEQLVSEYDEQGNPTSVPATIQTKYSIDAVEAIKTLEEKSYFESDIHDNLQAILTCINTNCASVLGGQFSISETATNKLFSFNFTANASTNSTEENPETI